jgi:hypothetical protein
MMRDKEQCHDWSVTQTGVLPQKYDRAYSACLTGRGYARQ